MLFLSLGQEHMHMSKIILANLDQSLTYFAESNWTKYPFSKDIGDNMLAHTGSTSNTIFAIPSPFVKVNFLPICSPEVVMIPLNLNYW